MKLFFPLAVVFFMVPIVQALPTEVAYSKAVACAQAGDWKKTQECLSSLVVDAPERLDLLYDNGVAAYRLSEFDKAAAYFQAVADQNAPNTLKKQAYFNLGNSHVALNKLSDAVADYQAVLSIEPTNEPAAHNLERVRQMMQEQNKQNEQDKQNNKNQHSKNQQKNNDTSEQDKKNDGSSDKKDEDQSENEGQDQSNNDSAGNEEKQQEPNQQHDGQQKDNADKKPNKQDSRNKQDELRDNHDSPSESMSEQKKSKERDEKAVSKTDPQLTKNGTKEQEIQAGSIEDNEKERKKEDNEQLLAQLGPDKKWMARILERQEQADEKAQKKLVKATVDKELAGQHDQNCW